MRIAQIAPLYEDVPPKFYGGTERVVYHICNGLVDRGHEVTLFATETSKTKAQLYPCRDQALRLDPELSWDMPANINQFVEVRNHIDDFDLLHFHTGIQHMPMFTDVFYKTITTQHCRQDIKDLIRFYDKYNNFPMVSISNNQRLPVPNLNWLGNVYHGYPLNQYNFTKKPDGDYLAFSGRISPEKGVDKAIEIAERVGMPLRIAAKIDPRTELMPTDREYVEDHIRPLLNDHPEIEFIGEINEFEKSSFLGNAIGTLFTTTSPEAFGLVMIESFACGTPVIAFNVGSIPEVVKEGISGFIVNDVDEAVLAVDKLASLDRKKVRKEFETKFSLDKMIDGYEEVYKKLLGI